MMDDDDDNDIYLSRALTSKKQVCLIARAREKKTDQMSYL